MFGEELLQQGSALLRQHPGDHLRLLTKAPVIEVAPAPVEVEEPIEVLPEIVAAEPAPPTAPQA